jgi:hypothetical protein
VRRIDLSRIMSTRYFSTSLIVTSKVTAPAFFVIQLPPEASAQMLKIMYLVEPLVKNRYTLKIG